MRFFVNWLIVLAQLLAVSPVYAATPRVTDHEIMRLKKMTSVSTNPASTQVFLYVKSDGKVYQRDSAGLETKIATGAGGGSSGNIIENYGFEDAVTGWVSNTNPVRITTPEADLGSGIASAEFTPSGAGDFLNGPLHTLPKLFEGQPAEASCGFKARSGTPNYTIEFVYQDSVGTKTILGGAIKLSTTQYQRTTMSFTFPRVINPTDASIQTYMIIRPATASEPAILIDECYIGINRNVSVSQLDNTTKITRILTGGGTFNPTPGATKIEVTVVGGGGGGGGGYNGGTGTAGGDSFFSTAVLAGGGQPGTSINNANTPVGGNGGAVTVMSPAVAINTQTGGKGSGGQIGANTVALNGAMGGASLIGPGGAAGSGGVSSNISAALGYSAAPNSGGGGGGAGVFAQNLSGGSGGGGGGAAVAQFNSPLASGYSYAVGVGGTGGAGGSGTSASGGQGGSGIIIIREEFQAQVTAFRADALGVSPSVQRFLSGSGTYTPSNSNVSYIRVRMVGGGGGGGGTLNGTPTPATAGTNSTFGGTLLVAGGGGAGNGGTGSTIGGASVGGVATATVAVAAMFDGSGGGAGTNCGAPTAASGHGGSSFFGGGGPSPLPGSSTGIAGRTNTGSGGSGATGNSGYACPAGGGGAAAYVEAILPATTYAYSVGTGGIAGVGGIAGGAGAAGQIIVEEFYNKVNAPLIANSVVSPDNATGVTRINTVKYVSADYTATELDETILVDTGSNNVTITLPAANAFKGKRFTIAKAADNFLVTIQVQSGSSNAIGTNSQTSTILHRREENVSFVSDGFFRWRWFASDSMRTEGATINTAASPSVTAQRGAWISSVTGGTAGIATVNFTANIFTGPPYCQCTADGNGGNSLCNIQSATASSILITTTASGTFTNGAKSATLVCFGQK